MALSLSKVFIHAVYGTKFRQPFINDDVREGYHQYTTGLFKALDCPILRINSMPDHTHILFKLSTTITIAKVMEITKKDSSKWFKTQGIKNFKWQGGYGVFSVSERGLGTVKNYIINQQKHHAKKSFKKEIAILMEQNNMTDYSEKYFWSK